MLLPRFLQAQFLRHLGFVLLFLLMLGIGTRLVRYFALAAKGELSAGYVGLITLLQLPIMLVWLLPFATFCACLWVFLGLKNARHLAVLQGAGVSPWQILRYLAPSIMALACVHGILSLQGSAWANQALEQAWQSSAVFGKSGALISQGDGYLYVQKNQGATMHGVVYLQPSQNRATTAKSAFTTQGNIVLQSGTHTLFDDKGSQQARFMRHVVKLPTATPRTALPLIKRLLMPFLLVIAPVLAWLFVPKNPRGRLWSVVVPAILSYALVVVAFDTLGNKAPFMLFLYVPMLALSTLAVPRGAR